MNTHSVHIIQEFKRRIEDVRRAYYREQILSGIFFSLSSFLLMCTAASLFEMLTAGGTLVRTLILFSVLVAVSAAAVWLIIIPLLRFWNVASSISQKEFVLFIGNHFPSIKDRLWNHLEIYQNKNEFVSSELIEASLLELQRLSAQFRFTEIISYERIKKQARMFGAIAVGIVVLFFVPQSELRSASYRLLHCRTEFLQPVPFYFSVHPGNKEVVKDESVKITISLVEAHNNAATSALPNEVTLLLQQQGVATQEKILLKKDSAGIFEHILPTLKQSVRYTAEANGMRSETFTITVTDRPFVRSLRLLVTPPAYAKLPPHYLDENVGDGTALAGSILTWKIIVSKEVQSAQSVFGDGIKKQLAVNNEQLTMTQKLVVPITYHIELRDISGVTNANPIEYKLDVLPDAVPTVTVLSPAKNIDITNEMKLPLQVKVNDDFGFSSLRLAYRLVQSKYEKPKEEFSFLPLSFSLSLSGQQVNEEIVNYLWDVSPLGLVPEDVIEYHIEVFDNDNVSGPKMGKSESYLLRLPSLEEVFADADKANEHALKNLDASLKDAEELKKDVEEISREMKKNQQADWQQQKKLEEVAKKFQEIQKKIDDVQKTVDAAMQELQKNNVLSTETMQKYMELQKLMQEMNTPEFLQAMKRMQEAMKQQANSEQLKQAMEQMQFSEEQFRSGIERTMNLLKRVQIEQKTNELVKRAKELQQQQDQLQKETDKMNPSDTNNADEFAAANKQDDINKQLEALQRELAELRKKMEEFPKEMPLEKLDKSEQAANDTEMKDAMKQSSQQLRSGQKQKAQQSQQQASRKMQQMSQQLSEMEEQMLANQMMETLNALKKAQQDLLQLSQKQEQLKNQSQRLDVNSPQLRENAQQQLNVQGELANVANALAELSQKSFVVTPEMGKAIGKAMAQMQQAQEGLEQRNSQAASTIQGDAMASLNKSATLVQSAMQSMQQGGQGGQGGSLLQQLQRMSAQQQSINMQTQQLGQQQGMSQQQMQEMGRLAKQQEMVRKSLEQLQREAEHAPDKNRMLGDLQKIAEEMKEVIQSLQQNNANPNTIKQQERILSRLLQAQSSQRERDFEQRRKATAGISTTRKSPSELSNENILNQLRRDVQKAREAGYTKDYQELIRKYYEAMERMKN